MSYALDNIRIFKKTLGFKLYPPTRFKAISKENSFNNIVDNQATKNVFYWEVQPNEKASEGKPEENETYCNDVERRFCITRAT